MSSEDLKKSGGLRKRIIGAIVLIALLVIFLPLFLEHVPQNVYLSQIPKQLSTAAVKPITTADFASPAPGTTKQIAGADSVWCLQLGSFAQPANATQLAQTLQKQGYPAYVRKFVANNAVSYKVFVGPETDKSRVQMWLDALKKKNLVGTIVPYEV